MLGGLLTRSGGFRLGLWPSREQEVVFHQCVGGPSAFMTPQSKVCEDGAMEIDRNALIDAIRLCVAKHEWVAGAWLGGADASNRVDHLSDVDLQLIVPDERIEAAFELMEAVLEDLGGIAHRWRLPEPTGNGHAQAVYLLANAPSHCFLDLCVMRRSSGVWYTERERHGEIVVLVDRDGLLDPLPLDEEALAARRASHIRHLGASLPVRFETVWKSIERGDISEASMRYHTQVLRSLIDLLRLKHCPERFDFKDRYLDRDLPPAEHALIEELSLPGSMEELRGVFLKARSEIEDLLATISP